VLLLLNLLLFILMLACRPCSSWCSKSQAIAGAETSLKLKHTNGSSYNRMVS
jgi:hypothetical protein